MIRVISDGTNNLRICSCPIRLNVITIKIRYEGSRFLNMEVYASNDSTRINEVYISPQSFYVSFTFNKSFCV